MKNLDHCPMGAAAITTSGFPINRERMAELLGFDRTIAELLRLHRFGRLYHWAVFRDEADLPASRVGWFRTWLSGLLSKSVNFMCRTRLCRCLRSCRRKRNPVPIEHLRHLASVTVGRCDMVVNTMHNTPFTDMNDSEGEVQQAGYAAFDSGGRVLDLLTAHDTRPARSTRTVCVKTTDAACITITELADTLVRDEGSDLPRRSRGCLPDLKAQLSRKVSALGSRGMTQISKRAYQTGSGAATRPFPQARLRRRLRRPKHLLHGAAGPAGLHFGDSVDRRTGQISAT